MGYVLGENLFTTRSSVDANHGDTDRPGRVANGHLKISVVRLEEHSAGTISKTERASEHRASWHCQMHHVGRHQKGDFSIIVMTERK